MTMGKPQGKPSQRWRNPATGVLLIGVTSLLIWTSRIGEFLDCFSYDSLFLFATKPAPRSVVIVRLDEAAHQALKQGHGVPWDRALHARLLDRLRTNGARLVVFDVFLTEPADATTNALLAKAIADNKRVVLAGDLAKPTRPGIVGLEPLPPPDIFRKEALAWGLDQIEKENDRLMARRHYAGTEVFPSLAWAAATKVDAPITHDAGERDGFYQRTRWLRYYQPKTGFTDISYHFALEADPEIFRDKVVFVGGKPRTGFVAEEMDEFHIPGSLWTGETYSGVDIQATMFLNLWNGDWLNQVPRGIELLVLLAGAAILGFGFSALPRPAALLIALLIALLVVFGVVSMANSYNVWFGWLTIVVFQIPAAFVWSLVVANRTAKPASVALEPEEKVTIQTTSAMAGSRDPGSSNPVPVAWPPPISGHTLLRQIGFGAYGEVWLAQTIIGGFRAIKIVRRNRFPSEAPFEREFRGMQKFTPFSLTHPGFVRILHVDRNEAGGYFYYVMETGDDEVSGQKIEPSSYTPRTLARDLARRGRLEVSECLRLGISLADALSHLHGQQLVHRDIKPSNIIFVEGSPKLADIGLVTDLGPRTNVTQIGTEGYMAPEGPGTAAADIYSLGKVLYEVAVGYDCRRFPELPTAILERAAALQPLFDLNEIILKACGPIEERFQTAGELQAALMKLEEQIQNQERHETAEKTGGEIDGKDTD